MIILDIKNFVYINLKLNLITYKKRDRERNIILLEKIILYILSIGL